MSEEGKPLVNYELPQLDQFVADNPDAPGLAEWRSHSIIQAIHYEGECSLFNAVLGEDRDANGRGFRLHGIRALYDHQRRRFMLHRLEHAYESAWKVIDKDGQFQLPDEYWSDHSFKNDLDALDKGPNEVTTRFFMRRGFHGEQYTRTFRLYMFPDLPRDSEHQYRLHLKYKDTFEELAETAFIDFVRSALPYDAVPNHFYDFNTEMIDWALAPEEHKHRERRFAALRPTAHLRQFLFTEEDYPWGTDSINRFKRIVGKPDITARIDQGEEVFELLADVHRVPVDSLREHVPLMLNRWANFDDNPSNIIRIMRLLPWLKLPMEDRIPDVRLTSDPAAQESIGFIEVRRYLDHAIKSMLGINDASQNWSNGTALFAATLLTEVFKPQLTTIGSSQVSWKLAAEHCRDPHSGLRNGVDVRDVIKSIASDLFMPSILIGMRRNGIANFTTEQLDAADNLAKSCVIDVLYASKGSELHKVEEIKKIGAIVNGFTAYAVGEDQSITADPVFMRLGFKLSDDDTQQGIFELYRDRVLDKRWAHCQTLTEFLIDAGLFRKVTTLDQGIKNILPSPTKLIT